MYVHAATIGTKLKHDRVTKNVVKSALLYANNGNDTKITIEKLSAAVETEKHCYFKPTNSYFFILRHFKVYVSKGFSIRGNHEILIYSLARYRKECA